MNGQKLILRKESQRVKLVKLILCNMEQLKTHFVDDHILGDPLRAASQNVDALVERIVITANARVLRGETRIFFVLFPFSFLFS